MKTKKIYKQLDILVDDNVINAADVEIDEAVNSSDPGTVIFTAGHVIEKQRGLDGKWVAMASGGGATTAGKDGITPKLQKTETAIQVSYDNGSSYEDLVQLTDLKGEKGDAGKDGAKGTDGKAGAAGAPGKDGVTPKLQKTATAIQVSYNDGESYEDLVPLVDIKGEQGDAGLSGKAGAKGDAGKSVRALTLKTDTEGKIVSGTVEFDDGSSEAITVTVESGE